MYIDEQDETAKEIKAARQKMRGAAGALSSVDQSHEDAVSLPPSRAPSYFTSLFFFYLFFFFIFLNLRRYLVD